MQWQMIRRPIAARTRLQSLLEIACVVVRRDHVARLIVNANYSIMPSAVLFGVADRIAGSVWSVIPTAHGETSPG